MKNFILLALMLTSVTVISQNAPIDFETDGYGANWTWAVFENDDNPPLEIIANPDMTGANTSATVAKFTARQTGQPWAGCESMHGADIGTYSINTTNSTIKIMVWKTVISDVGIKLVKPDGWSLGEIKVANTMVNEWEELTFDFSSQMEEGYDQIVVFPDFDLNGRTQDNIIYFDNITFHEMGSGTPSPEEAAPIPTQNQANVISMYSDAYTNVAVDTWRTPWSEAILEDIMIDGNPTKKYSAVNFAGIETVGPNLMDVTEMTHFHLDIWTPDANDFKVKLVDFGADQAFGGGDDTEHEIIFVAPATESWISYNIPLADFTNLLNRNHIAQLILSKPPLGTFYLDNVYYYNDLVGLAHAPSNELSVYPNPTNSVWYLNSEEIIHEIQIYDLSGRLIITEHPHQSGIIQIDAFDLESGMYLLRINGNQIKDFKIIKD
jgi:hypothetical protein